MGAGEKITQEIFGAVDILVSQKIKDTDYSQTIKCQVKERVKGSDMYMVLYKSEEIRVMSMGATYDKGDKVIVLLPDKNSLSPKFILGRTNDRTPTITVGQGGEISQAVLKEIQDALNTIADIASDNVVSASEKGLLAIQWKNLQTSYAAQMKEVAIYGDAIGTEMLEARYEELKSLIEPILENMEISTPVSGTELRDRFGHYYFEEQAIRSLILAEIRNKIAYQVRVNSSNGTNFMNDDIDTEISVEAFRGSENITGKVPNNSFKWTKILKNGLVDQAWTNGAVGIGSTFSITKEDIDERATFRCELIIPISGKGQMVGTSQITITNLQDVSNIQFGAKNLIRNSSFSDEWSSWRQTGLSLITTDIGPKGFVAQASGEFSLEQTIEFSVDEDKGTDFTFSSFIANGSTKDVLLKVSFGNLSWNMVASKGTSQWIRVANIFKDVFTTNSGRFLDLKIETVSTLPPTETISLSLGSMQLERGSVMTDYSKANSDIEDKFTSQGNLIIDLGQRADSVIDTVINSDEFATQMGDKVTVDELNQMSLSIGEDITGLTGTVNQYGEEVSLITESLENTNLEINKVKDRLDLNFKNAAGINMLRNSTGWFGKEDWVHEVGSDVQVVGNTDMERLGFGREFMSPATVTTLMTQEVLVSEGVYNINFWMRSSTNAGFAIEILNASDNSLLHKIVPVLENSASFFQISNFYRIPSGMDSIKLKVVSNSGERTEFAGFMMTSGEQEYRWSSHYQEIANTNIQFNINGIKVQNINTQDETIMSPEEFAGYTNLYNPETGLLERTRIFTLNGETTEVTDLKATKYIRMGNITLSKVDNKNKTGVGSIDSEGWAFYGL